jgi:release factor glutamine methyltransferase
MVAAPRSAPVSPGAPRSPSAGRAPATVRSAVRDAQESLGTAGCPTPRLDAELLLAEALGVDRAALYTDPYRRVEGAARLRFAGHRARRAAREPVAYILGHRGFRRIELRVDRRVLVPRPETELLVELAIAELPRGAHVHDAGTGSGAVALALADERPDLRVTASDASAAALEVARGNGAWLGLEVEWLHGRDLPRRPGVPDLVVANLPYVREDEWPSLDPEIARYEPRDALVGGGHDGLDAIRALVESAPRGVRVALEHAPGQAGSVTDLLRDAGTVRGLDGEERVTVGRVR